MKHIIDTDELEKLPTKFVKFSKTDVRECVTLDDLRALIANSPQADGMVLVPIVPNKEMSRVLNEEDWQWEDLLAAAEAITEEQYSMLSAYKPQADGMVLVPLEPTEEMCNACFDFWRKPPNSLHEAFIGAYKAMLSAYKPQADDVRKDAETAWLVEKDIGGLPNYLYCDCIGLLSWTPSNQKAMRFARKEDADSIVSIVEDADRVAQHMWSSAIDKARE